MLKDEILEYLHTVNGDAEGILIDPGKLIFEENVKMNCFYCGKYNNNWKCPPNLPDIDYKRMMKEYEVGMAVVLSFPQSGCISITVPMRFLLLAVPVSCVRADVERTDVIIHICQGHRLKRRGSTS